ncbi:unnamed protein product [Heligmosomoides polygyrus]|uniref:ORC4_C domain-containing protein n=1 Tax=Heligmosomoides polygyrus TaxID=6339 RepID=A0A183FX09_HELPZ|nr:unnamed protein product [Heligmosomoides polygyrus]
MLDTLTASTHFAHRPYDVNSVLRATKKGQETDVRLARLDYDEFIAIHQSIAQSKESELRGLIDVTLEDCSASNVLKVALRKVVDPIVEDCIRDILQPALNRIDSLRAEKRQPTASITVDEAVTKKRKILYENEKRARSRTAECLATDLHRMLLRICYENPKPEIIQHMVHYNYPLSAHCATVVFDSVLPILDALAIRSFQVYLNRENQKTAFTYMAKSKKRHQGDDAIIRLALERDCFYICMPEESEVLSAYHTNVFDALSDELRCFYEAYPLGSVKFVQAVEQGVKSCTPVDAAWERTVQWHSNEKLVCPF